MDSQPAVAVLGGGIIGLSIAWRAAQAGAKVDLFESGRVGEGASWTAAGMLAPGGEYFEASPWQRFAQESLEQYPSFVEELISASGLNIDYRRCGAFSVALDEPEAEQLRARAESQSAAGIYTEQFPSSRIPGICADAVAAQYYPDDAAVNPRDVLRALRLACGRAGVALHENSPVAAVPVEQYDRVVVAAGAWSSVIELERHALPVSFPVRGHLVAFEEATGLCDAIIRHKSTYLLRRAEHQIIAGSSTENAGWSRVIDGEIAHEIAGRAGDLIPVLRGRPYTAWNGLRPATESGEPLIGRVPGTSVWLAYGHYRNGILLAPATARRVVGELFSDESTQASLQKDYSSLAGSSR